MIWRIVRKDFRLLWPFAVGVVALEVLSAVIALRLGIYGEPQSLMNSRPQLDLVTAAATALLIVALVHQDRVVGGVQDWLVRPFRRSDVLLAKLLFVALVIVVPQWCLSVAVGLLQQRPVAEIIAAATEAAVILFTGQLPVVMIASLAGTLLEAIVGILLFCILTYPLFVALSPFFVITGPATLFPWMQLVLRVVVAVAAAAVVLPLQYFERRTSLARGAFAALLLFYCLLLFLPWNAVFAAQKAISPEPSYADAVKLSFDPAMGPYRPKGVFVPAGPSFYLPLKISGLPRDAILNTERTHVTVIGRGGAVLYSGVPPEGVALWIDEDGSPNPRLRPRLGSNGIAATHQQLFIPAATYARISDLPVRLRLSYSLTLFQATPTVTLPTIGARRRIPGIGDCATGMRDSFEIDVSLSCYAEASAPRCFVDTVRDRDTGLRNPETGFCTTQYDPRLIRLARLSSDSGHPLLRYRFAPPIEQPDAILPVGPDRLAKSDLIVTPYVVRVWFSRTLETPMIRLRDFAARLEKPRTALSKL